MILVEDSQTHVNSGVYYWGLLLVKIRFQRNGKGQWFITGLLKHILFPRMCTHIQHISNMHT